VALDEGGVGHEQEKRQPVGYPSGYRRAVEANAEDVDEEVIQQGVERGGDEQNVSARAVDF
jgi:hypothetical protein